jgi:hypothetical protein
MNKLIKELAEQSGASFPGTLLIAKGLPAVEFADIDEFYMFAELIIKECSNIAFKLECNDTSESYSNIIKEYFEIK